MGDNPADGVSLSDYEMEVLKFFKFKFEEDLSCLEYVIENASLTEDEQIPADLKELFEQNRDLLQTVLEDINGAIKGLCQVPGSFDLLDILVSTVEDCAYLSAELVMIRGVKHYLGKHELPYIDAMKIIRFYANFGEPQYNARCKAGRDSWKKTQIDKTKDERDRRIYMDFLDLSKNKSRMAAYRSLARSNNLSDKTIQRIIKKVEQQKR